MKAARPRGASLLPIGPATLCVPCRQPGGHHHLAQPASAVCSGALPTAVQAGGQRPPLLAQHSAADLGLHQQDRVHTSGGRVSTRTWGTAWGQALCASTPSPEERISLAAGHSQQAQCVQHQEQFAGVLHRTSCFLFSNLSRVVPCLDAGYAAASLSQQPTTRTLGG